MFRLAKQFKGGVCKDTGRSLFNVRSNFLHGRSRRVSHVAISIMFNVHQPNPKPMTMSTCSLDHYCVSPVYVIHLVHHVVHSRYSGDGSLRIGSLGTGSLHSKSLGSGSLHSGSLGSE